MVLKIDIQVYSQAKVCQVFFIVHEFSYFFGTLIKQEKLPVSDENALYVRGEQG